MDDLDGLEVLENIRTETNKVPVILNSAYSTYKNNFTSWLADAYLVKSSNLSELKDKVRELLTV
jgi:DNA-binding response OmpR family regulator